MQIASGEFNGDLMRVEIGAAESPTGSEKSQRLLLWEWFAQLTAVEPPGGTHDLVVIEPLHVTGGIFYPSGPLTLEQSLGNDAYLRMVKSVLQHFKVTLVETGYDWWCDQLRSIPVPDLHYNCVLKQRQPYRPRLSWEVDAEESD
jgi:hypothetical protein